MPISPLMDRSQPGMSASQARFTSTSPDILQPFHSFGLLALSARIRAWAQGPKGSCEVDSRDLQGDNFQGGEYRIASQVDLRHRLYR